MRRLPIYFLIDVSESMVGTPIKKVEEGIGMIIRQLKTDAQAMETVWISIVIFAGQPKTLTSLQDLVSFYPPAFPIGGGTSLSKGLGHLMFELRANIKKTTTESKGDWKPIVYLFTDGTPTDDTSVAIQEWTNNWARSANMVAVSMGRSADLSVLRQLTDNVLEFDSSDPTAYAEFFKWVTDSIKTNSESVDSGSDLFDIGRFDGEKVTKADFEKRPPRGGAIDDNYVVLAGKCSNTKRPYLIKYQQQLNEESIGGLDFSTKGFRLVGAYEVDDSYFSLSDEAGVDRKVNTHELMGAPTCPSCGNQHAFAVCQCGKLHCIGNEAESTCPWCGATGTYGSGTGGFDVNRAQG